MFFLKKNLNGPWVCDIKFIHVHKNKTEGWITGSERLQLLPYLTFAASDEYIDFFLFHFLKLIWRENYE